jgi:hypothetical protein
VRHRKARALQLDILDRVATAPILCRGLFRAATLRTHGIKNMPWLLDSVQTSDLSGE